MFLLYILYIGSKAESPNKSPSRVQVQVHVPSVGIQSISKSKSPKNSWLPERNTMYKSWVPIVQFQVTTTVQAESSLPESQVIKSLKCLQCCTVADSTEVTSNKEGTCRSFLHGVYGCIISMVLVCMGTHVAGRVWVQVKPLVYKSKSKSHEIY